MNYRFKILNKNQFGPCLPRIFLVRQSLCPINYVLGQLEPPHRIPVSLGVCKLCCAEKPSVTVQGCRKPQLQPVPDSTKEDWWGLHVQRWRGCDYYLLAFLLSNACLIYLTCGPEGQTSLFCFARTYPKFTIHSLFDLGWVPHLPASLFICRSLTLLSACSLLVSSYCLQIYTHTICQLSNLRAISRLLKRKGRFQHTSLICS